MRDIKATPLWQPLEARGDRSVILNVPGTYPAPPIRGVLVSGFVAPDFDRAVFPGDLREPLRRLNYQLDVEIGDVHADPFGFMDRVDSALAARREAFHRILDGDGPCGGADARLAICVYTETDRVHHFLWRDLMDPQSPVHERILDFYHRVDTAVGDLAERAGDGGLMLVSDHGFGDVTTQFYVNAWLRSADYLSLPATATALTEIDEATVAFALDPGRIFVNRAGRFPRGREVADDLVAEISERLLALRRLPDGSVVEGGTGEPVVADVLRGDELYHGPCASSAADLILVPAAGVQIRGAWQAASVVLDGPLTGTHTREDALFWCRDDYSEGPVEMRDVARTVLGYFGLDAPAGMEGCDVRNHATKILHTGRRETR
jgi:predicted AlkP superfamily phosphohydrolase/phosphomutase